jgi:hypothetical protein
MPGVKGRSGGKRMGAGRIGFCPTDENKHLVKFLAGLGLQSQQSVARWLC